jgi:hypothetical protein
MGEIRDYLVSLPSDRFPHVVAMAGKMVDADRDGPDRFELGLEIIMRGIASYQEKGKAGDGAGD